MKLISWNVNGIRSALGKGFAEFVAAAGPDILCVQESRALPEQVDLDIAGYTPYWNPAQRKGYAGTLTLSRIEPVGVTLGLGIEKLDTEGRVLTLELDDFYLVNVYTPNSGGELARLPYRSDSWDTAFLAFAKGLEAHKPVVFCGDLNVAHTELDLAAPKSHLHSAGFTPAERAGFDRIVEAGFIDTFREFHTDGGHYTWWSYKLRARSRNLGWRIDYFCISPALRPRLSDASILAEVMGSDHCPIQIILS